LQQLLANFAATFAAINGDFYSDFWSKLATFIHFYFRQTKLCSVHFEVETFNELKLWNKLKWRIKIKIKFNK
jgi:hypothetical protein